MYKRQVIAAVCKLMSNLDLIYAAARMRVKATCVTTIGEPGTLSARLQPNHPVDDVEGKMCIRDRKRPLLLSRKKNNAAATLKWMKMEFIARKPDTQQKSEFLDLSKKNRLLDRPD